MGTRILLGAVALLFLPYGLFCFFRPDFLAGAAGVASVTATGSTELRAMYGGLQTGVGLLALAALRRSDLTRPALVAVAFLAGGLGIARVSGAALDSGWSAYTGLAIALELSLLTLCLWRLQSEPRVRG